MRNDVDEDASTINFSISSPNHKNSTPKTHSTFDGSSHFVETREASRSARADIRRLLLSNNSTAGTNSISARDGVPQDSNTLRLSEHPQRSWRDDDSNTMHSQQSFQRGRDQPSVSTLARSQTGNARNAVSLSTEETENRSVYTTPSKASSSLAFDNNEDVSINMADRHNKVKAIMERVNKLKSSSSQASSHFDDRSLDSHSHSHSHSHSNHGSNIFRSDRESKVSISSREEQSTIGPTDFRNNNNLSPVSMASTLTHKSVSTFRAEMMKFKEKWRIKDDSTMGHSDDVSMFDKTSNRDLKSATSLPSEVSSRDSSSVMEEDFRIVSYKQNDNESKEGMKKEIFEISRENLTLQGKIKFLERTNVSLSEQHQSEIRVKNDQIMKLEKEIMYLREEGSSHAYDNFENKTEKLQMASMIERLQAQLESKEREISSLRLPRSDESSNDDEASTCTHAKQTSSKMKSLEDEQEKLQKQLRQSFSKVSELEALVSAKEKEISMLKSEVELSRCDDNQNLRTHVEMQKLRQEKKETRHEKEIQLLKKEIEQSNKTIVSLQQELSTLQEKLSEAESKGSNMNGLKAMLKESESFLAHLEKDKELLIERHQAEVDSCRKELAEKERASYHVENDFVKQIRTLEKEKETLAQEVETISKEKQARIATLEQSLSTEEENVSSLRTKISQCTSSLEEKSRLIIQLEHDIEDLQSELSDKSREKAAADLEIKTLTANFEREKEKHAKQLESELKESAEAISTLEKASLRKDKYVESLQDEVRRLSTAKIERNGFQQNREGRKNLVDFIEKELETVRGQKADIEKELEAAIKEMRAMESKMNSQRKSFKKKIHDLENETEMKDNAIVSLQDEINELNKCIEGKILLSKGELQQMENELTNAKRIIEQDGEVQRVLANYNELKKSNTALKELVNVLREKHRHQEEKLRTQYKEIIELRDEKDTSVNDYVDEIEKLKVQAANAVKEKEAAEAKLKENSKLLSKAESIMAKTNEATLSAVMQAINLKKSS